MRLSHSARTVFCAALTVSLLAPAALSQVRHPGTPAASLLPAQEVPELLVPPPNVELLRAEDEANRAAGIPGPLRFGVPVPMPFVFEQHAVWDITDDGEQLVGRLTVTGPGAHSLGLEFAEWELHPQGRLFVYDPDMQHVFGAYTMEEQIPTGEFVIEPFPGETVIIEYSQPALDPPAAHMVLRNVIYDYADVFAMERRLDEQENQLYSGDDSFSGGCTVNVNCPDGDPYELHKRSTVRTVFGGGLCSASLINNTANDETRYVYTAAHCGQGSTTVFRFNYQTPNCSGGGAPTNQQVSGCVVLDSDTDTDGRLLRITNNIPDSYNPYYAGWSRSNASLSLGVSMHHPGGSPKCISIDFNGGGMTTANFQGIGPVKVWSMNFQVGGTQGGSSGGPLFDQNGRIRGTLTGGPSNCAISYYGRFHNFWNDDDIGEWLDPGNTGVTTLDGYDPFADLTPAGLASLGTTSGPAGGFTPVQLFGSGFDAVSSVQFGGVEALSFNVVNNTLINATTPEGTVGTVNVSVTDSFGTSTLNSAFSYTPNPTPAVDTIAPNTGNVTGGATVTISGTNVLGVTDVQFGGVSGTNLVIQSPTELKVDTPPAASSGEVDVTVLGNGSDVIVDGFGYFNQGSFTSIGPGLAGTFGSIPFLSGTGDLIPGGVGFSLITAAALPNTTGLLWASLTETALPFKGGTLYLFPIQLSLAVTASPFGSVVMSGLPVDPAIPEGTAIIVQEAFVDAGAVAGVSLSNGLRITIGG